MTGSAANEGAFYVPRTADKPEDFTDFSSQQLGILQVVPSELFPTFFRPKGKAFAMSFKSVVAIALSQITPLALAKVNWRFYALFIACNTNTAAFALYPFFVPETGSKTLEEIIELFGDTVAVDIFANIGKIDTTSVVHASGSEPRIQ
ncbi:high-affinity glucose transporter [Fusarium mexicanum]|uniref:High-affinity glucose transporter n=1 Tax=Fusarium mexicanum TaxID=751941 RepID=A0A8H5N345_9HYPO|nr:high-affinity glucose transporter [Fusarium mexicanum]